MPMSLETFHDLVDTYGSRLTEWPASVRQDVDQLLLESSEARAVLAAARDVDTLLRSVEPVSAPMGLLDRICQAARETEPTDDVAPPRSPDASPFWSDFGRGPGLQRRGAPGREGDRTAVPVVSMPVITMVDLANVGLLLTGVIWLLSRPL
ncbi:hypothetical protein [Insolitispirillum peregrinum]|uniref:hypothetical protein n=1 Tax=Insolitispirillum peregrinum TaxID=80876 RepID=UPI0036130DD0